MDAKAREVGVVVYVPHDTTPQGEYNRVQCSGILHTQS